MKTGPYRYTCPPGWTPRPSPNGRLDDAIYLRGPAHMPSAAILLLPPVPKVRSLADEVTTQVTTQTTDGQLIERLPPRSHATGQLPAMVQSVVVRIKRGQTTHDERRTFAVLESPRQFLTAVLVAGPAFAFFHEPAFLKCVDSVFPVSEVPIPID